MGAVEALIAQETAALKATDERGNNLLHIACQNNNRHIAKLLIGNGISVNAQNTAGNTPLHYCSQYGFMQLADYLLAHGAACFSMLSTDCVSCFLVGKRVGV